MTEVERWTLRWVAPEITNAHPTRPNALVRGPGVPWHGEEVEVVPASDLEGAVDALRWALGFIEYQGEPSPLDDPREGHEDAESHRRAQAIVGGQSS